MRGTLNAAANTIRKLIDEKSAYEFNCECKEKVADHDRLIMAMIGKIEKQGKGRSVMAVRSDGPFPFFSTDRCCGKVPLPMQNREPDSISDLYPEFSREQREQAQANVRRYLAALLRMEDRLQAISNAAVDCQFDSDAGQRYHPNAKGRPTNSSSPNS
ncbi:MAG TPA: hypothetical protein VFT88_11095 [Acidobacteriaceae bacterium]|nr:hypothetical protein [Acidobacteriaceae bacterium]